MRRLLDGATANPRTEEHWVAFELFGNAFVIAGDYKVLRVRTGMFGDGKWHLYNIRKDPGETKPLEGLDPERMRRMVTIYEQYAKQKGIVPVDEDWNPWRGSDDQKK